MTKAIKVLAIMEATTVSGPAKNLIDFSRRARVNDDCSNDLPAVEVSIATFHRGHSDGSHIAPGLPSNGDDQTAIASEVPNAFVAAARAAGIEVEIIGERFRFDRRVLSDIRAIVGRRQPDIVQTHNVKSHFLLKLSGLWRHYPWIAFQHGYTTTDFKMQVYNQLDRWSLPSADLVVAVCNSFARNLARSGVPAERIRVQHNSVNPALKVSRQETSALKQRMGLSEGERVVLVVGRLSYEKGHVDLINSLAHLRRTNPKLNFKLVIVGDGPERGRVERAIAAHELRDQVVFCGQVSDTRPFYAVADVLALPSHSEGSPNVVFEAMASGLPVVACAVGGVPEIVEHERSGLLVAPGDVLAMAAGIARLMDDANLARTLAASASELVAARYSPETYRHSLVELYSGLMRSRLIADRRIT